MTKKQLAQRLMDIAYGAGVQPRIDDDYWDNMSPKSLYKYLQGIQSAFELDEDSFLLSHHNLDEYDCPSSVIDFYWRNLEEWK